VKIVISFNLKHEILTQSYRAFLLHFFKKALDTQYKSEYERIYQSKTIKSYTFSTFIKNIQYIKDNIIVKDKKFYVTISSLDYSFIVLIFNAMNHLRDKKIYIENDNIVYFNKAQLLSQKEITTTNINVKFLSPLLVRKHDKENNRDSYLLYDDNDFEYYLNESAKEIAKLFEVEYQYVNIIPIKPIKTVSKGLKAKYSCSLGTYELKSSIEMLNLLYCVGIGSRRGEGFGMFELINDDIKETQ